MRDTTELVEECRVKRGYFASKASDGNNGVFFIEIDKTMFTVIVSDGQGWDHVSVSLPDRNPTWGEMETIRDLFFKPEEIVIQFSPPRVKKINNHPNCLHLWREQGAYVKMPPVEFV